MITYTSGDDLKNLFQGKTSCLSYDTARKLEFTDIKDTKALGAAEALVLKNTYYSYTSPNQKLEDLKKQYPLSGANSTVSGDNQTEAKVNLPLNINRFELAKLVMLTHCIPVFEDKSLPELTFNGRPMPIYADAPEKGTVMSHVLTSASFFEILDGTNPGGKIFPGQPNYIEWSRPAQKGEAAKMINRAGETWQGFQSRADYNLPKEFGITTMDWPFVFYARLLKENPGQTPILKVPSMLENIYNPASRAEVIAFLVQSLFSRGLYNAEDAAAAQAALHALQK